MKLKYIKKSFLNNQKGLGIIEVVIVTAILITTFVSLLQLAFLEQRAQTLARQDTAAYIYAREALEAVRSIRDSDWANISALNNSTAYYPQVNVSNQWELSTTNPGTVGGIYTQWVEFEEVFRDANDQIAASGTSDSDTRKVTAYVQWVRPGGDTRSVNLTTYITNWQSYQ